MNAERAEQPPSGDGPRAPGAPLRAGREAMGWSVEQVAEQLKLQARQVVALEADDLASLPNLAVVRGFIRAYAKILRLDPVPLVAMIADPAASSTAAGAPARRERSASFSEARFPSMTQRSSKPIALLGGVAVLLLAAAGFGAYQMGLIPASLLTLGGKGAAPAPAAASAPAASAPLDTTLVKPEEVAPPAPSVPLISVPGPAADAPATMGAPGATVTSSLPLVPSAAPAKAAEAPAKSVEVPAAVNNALVINVREDSWVEIRRAGAAPLISRLVRAGSSESFDITGPVQLVVGRPSGVEATLRGAALELKPVPGGTAARMNLK